MTIPLVLAWELYFYCTQRTSIASTLGPVLPDSRVRESALLSAEVGQLVRSVLRQRRRRVRNALSLERLAASRSLNCPGAAAAGGIDDPPMWPVTSVEQARKVLNQSVEQNATVTRLLAALDEPVRARDEG